MIALSRLLGLLAFCVTGVGPLSAQEKDVPLVNVSFEETEAIPGQPLDLRLTVLVSTYMTKAATFPSFDAPNLLVRLPEGATGPTSQRIGSETWSGVTRRYVLYPMIAGPFALPPQEIKVTWSDPDGGPTRQSVVLTPLIRLAGVLPDGAGDLDPFIAAQALSLSQEVTGADGPLKPGESVIRTVSAEIVGTSPMYLPVLLPDQQIEGLAAYGAEPVVTEFSQDGILSGTRSESVTLIAESGGSGTVAPVSLRWYNLETGRIETASLDGFDLSVDAPVAETAEPLDVRVLALLSMCVVIAATLLFFGVRSLSPRIRAYLVKRKTAIRESESWAFAEVQRMTRMRDLDGVLKRLDLWAVRCAGQDPRTSPDLHTALTAVGAARYRLKSSAEGDAWRHLERTLQTVRRLVTPHSKETAVLPLLNPRACDRRAPRLSGSL